MNPTAIYIGDEVAAAGYRLAGVQVLSPAAGDEAEALRGALRNAELVLLSADCAARLPASLLRAVQTALQPLVAIVPGTSAPMPDVARRMRSQLGLEA